MEQHLERFLATLVAEKGYSENTLAAYRNDLGQFSEFVSARLGGAFDPAQITPDLIEAYVADLQHGTHTYAMSTVARKVAAIKTFCHFLLAQKTIESDPTIGLSSPKVKKHVPRTLTRGEIERLLAAPARNGGSKAARDRALLELLAATGLRVTEVVNLRLEDVDWEKGVVICRGKGERQRKIPLGPAQASLREYLQRARPELAKEKSPNTVFLNHRGQQLTRQGVWLILKDAAHTAGISAEITPHTLRHSFARYLIGAGEDLRRVQELLGHANLSTTQLYRHTAAQGQPGE